MLRGAVLAYHPATRPPTWPWVPATWACVHITRPYVSPVSHARRHPARFPPGVGYVTCREALFDPEAAVSPCSATRSVPQPVPAAGPRSPVGWTGARRLVVRPPCTARTRRPPSSACIRVTSREFGHIDRAAEGRRARPSTPEGPPRPGPSGHARWTRSRHPDPATGTRLSNRPGSVRRGRRRARGPLRSRRPVSRPGCRARARLRRSTSRSPASGGPDRAA